MSKPRVVPIWRCPWCKKADIQRGVPCPVCTFTLTGNGPKDKILRYEEVAGD